MPGKIDFFKICLEKSKFFVKLLEKIEIFRTFAWKIEFFFTRIRDPQISNQIDAAANQCACALDTSNRLIVVT